MYLDGSLPIIISGDKIKGYVGEIKVYVGKIKGLSTINIASDARSDGVRIYT